MLVAGLKSLKRTVYRFALLRIAPVVARLTGRRPVHFLHVGKTGGTAVKAAFGAYPFPWFATPDDLLIFHTHSVTLSDLPQGSAAIVFLRDPVARFISAFGSRKRKGMPRRYVPWTKAEKRAFMQFETPNALANGLLSGDPAEQAAAKRAMRSIEHVAQFQIDWCGGDLETFRRRRNEFILIGQQKTLTEDFDRLLSRLSLAGQLTLPKSDKAAHRSTEKIELNDAQVTALSQWYTRDYALLEALSSH